MFCHRNACSQEAISRNWFQGRKRSRSSKWLSDGPFAFASTVIDDGKNERGHMEINRRAFLTSIREIVPISIMLGSVGTASGRDEPSPKQSQCLSKSPTLAHECLAIESAIGATEEDCRELESVILRTLTRIQPHIAEHELHNLGKGAAVDILNNIGESLDREGFLFNDRSTLLFRSLRTHIIACHHATVIIFSLGERVGLPLVMLKVPSHIFLRLRLGNGGELNWDIYLENNGITADDNQYRRLYQIDKQTERSGGYLRNLTPKQMLALEYNAIGVAWAAVNEPGQAAANFSRAIALDPRFPEAYRNRGAAKCDHALAIMSRKHAQREELYSAIADLKEAVKINPKYAEALFSLGLAHYALRELDAARSYCNAAANLDPRYSSSALFSVLNIK